MTDYDQVLISDEANDALDEYVENHEFEVSKGAVVSDAVRWFMERELD